MANPIFSLTGLKDRTYQNFLGVGTDLTCIRAEEPKLTQVIAYTAAGYPEYIGEAAPGTAKGALLWRIKKLTYSGTNVTDVQWADSVTTFTKEWDERATYTYA